MIVSAWPVRSLGSRESEPMSRSVVGPAPNGSTASGVGDGVGIGDGDADGRGVGVAAADGSGVGEVHPATRRAVVSAATVRREPQCSALAGR